MLDKKFLFEVSWEVCNKVGGIHTVIRSKLDETRRQFGDNYCLVGPLFDHNPEFEEDETIDLRNVRFEMKRLGITAKIGRWKSDARPLVVLVKSAEVLDHNKLLFQLWEDFGVDSMTGGWDYIEPVLFSTVAAKVIEVMSAPMESLSVTAIFHEWMCGAGMLYLKKNTPLVSTIFVTHATMLGRSIASGADLYGRLQKLEFRAEANRLHVKAKHSMETASAREADCFATVSEITAMEATHVLGREPDLVLPNGFYAANVPSYGENRAAYAEDRRRLLETASRFLGRELKSENTTIISSSGRNEFHNKGIDVLLEAVARLRKESRETEGRNILLALFVLGGYVDPNRPQRRPEEGLEKFHGLATHPLWAGANDPIVVKCRESGMQNDASDRVSVIYFPVYLNGADGVLNMDYYDALRACDLTVYPSYYEPWGYTPLESIAYSVPTVTTDLAGFGRWVNHQAPENESVKVISRFGKSDEGTVEELKKILAAFLRLPSGELEKLRDQARSLALTADWTIFYKEYLKAFAIAEAKCLDRSQGRAKGQPSATSFTGTDSTRPRLRKFSVKASLPREIEGLRDLAYNLWWSWDMDATDLFSRLDPVKFEETGYNPISLLESIEPEQLASLAGNENFMSQYDSVMKRFEGYLTKPRILLQDVSPLTRERPVAYFSMEFGLHESLPVYSGGLGILAGDHIKSASDMNFPLVGVGLLYKNGYFRQTITKEGEQREVYPVYDFFAMPLREVQKKGHRLMIAVEMPGRILYARVWEVRVGRVTLYLLDSDVAENNTSDREITAKLYGGGRKTRIEQEMLLGIGGVRLLERELNLFPSVYHMNEGHSAFLVLERTANLMRYDELDFDTAREVVRTSTVFTTHTPVVAGNETFDMAMVENYLKPYLQSVNLDWREVVEMGHKQFADQATPYELTVLALRSSCRRNGVSRLHGRISRHMWADLWQGFLLDEVPISHITNGVHAPTWLTTEMKTVFSKYAAITLNADLLDRDAWKKVEEIPSHVIWHTHLGLKNRLFNTIKYKISNNWLREGEEPGLIDSFMASLDPSPLTIGFSRRFALYKRPDLFLKNLDRIKKILHNPRQPVQFVIAGKAHPEDKMAHGLIKNIVELSKQKDFLGRLIFIEDYDMRSARRLVSGVDVWLNNPRRPLEASGTSGQKAGINGVVNFSVLDGWWDEGYDGTNGWAIGHRQEYKNTETQDLADSESFYDVLESEIIPTYYNRNNQGVPEKWVGVMKRSMISVISEFNTHRMLKDYIEQMYIPASKKYFSLFDRKYGKAKKIGEWKKSLRSRFSSLHIKNIVIDGIVGDNLSLGDEVTVNAEIDKGRVAKEEIRVELLLVENNDPAGAETGGEIIKKVTLAFGEEKDGLLAYSGRYKAERSGKFGYGIRVVPYHPELDECDIKDINAISWG